MIDGCKSNSDFAFFSVYNFKMAESIKCSFNTQSMSNHSNDCFQSLFKHK